MLRGGVNKPHTVIVNQLDFIGGNCPERAEGILAEFLNETVNGWPFTICEKINPYTQI